MRSNGAGSERSPAARGRTGRTLVPLAVAGAAVVVLSTALAGRARITPLELGGPTSVLQAPAPDLSAPPVAPPPAAEPGGPDGLIQTVLLALVLAVALAVAAILIRLIVAAILDRRRRERLTGLRGVTAEDAVPVADAPAVVRGIAAALLAFEEDRTPGDAVVRAWLGLQQAAEDAGFARSPAETPTEFTGRVLSRTGADRAALSSLLRLYLRARFGDGAITADDAAGAREALRALEASWTRLATADRG